MFPPCEMMTKNFLPPLRGLVAHRMKKKGLGQTSIAKLLGVTQSAVSQMLQVDEKKFLTKLEDMGIAKKETALLVQALCDELEKNPVNATRVLYMFWRDLLSKGRLCEFHRKMHPQLADCDICIGQVFATEFDQDRIQVLKALEKCVEKLESNRAFRKLIPEVGTNVVYSIENPATTNDVAGVAGRLVSVDDEVKAVGRAVFGGSHHLAIILLTAQRFNKNIRSAINIRYSSEILRAMESLGIKHVVVEPSPKMVSDQTVVEDVEKSFREVGGTLEAVAHGGGIGFEAITYVFAENPDKLVNKVFKIAAKVL